LLAEKADIDSSRQKQQQKTLLVVGLDELTVAVDDVGFTVVVSTTSVAIMI